MTPGPLPSVGDLVILKTNSSKLAMRPGFGGSSADDLAQFVFRLAGRELGLVVGHDVRPSGRTRILVCFAGGIDSTLYHDELDVVSGAHG